MVELLLQQNAKPNQIDLAGISPLMYATKINNLDIIKLLLKYGGDPYLKSKDGLNSSFDFARLTGNEVIIPVLEDTKKNRQEEIHISDLIGQETAKRQLNEIISLSKLNRERIKKNMKEVSVILHCVYFGNPGTGKTTFARFFAQEIKKIGFLKKAHLVEVSRNDLIAKYSGQTAEKTTKVFNQAIDGVLFIDEAYSLKIDENDQFGQECINTLISLIENNRSRIIIILAGYKEEMQNFLHLNPGLKTDARNIVMAIKEISKLRKERSFGNAREVRNVIDRGIVQQSVRLTNENKTDFSKDELSTLIFSDFTFSPLDQGDFDDFNQQNKQVNSPMEKLNRLIGINEIKSEISELANFVEVSKLRSPNALPEIGLHMVFTGNPGTGKTTVARILGELFKNLDLLSSGHLVEVDRSQLVAPFVGQTAIKTKETIERALGGILFIDEAYTLFRNEHSDNFGLECIDTLLKYMEDFRNRLVIIFAGYPEQMDVFLKSNPGLNSRINRTLNFPDFTDEELILIAQSMANEKNYVLDDKAKNQLGHLIAQQRSKMHFGNARTTRNLLENSYKKHANRMIDLKKTKNLSKEELNTLIEEDFIF
ncbi:MAG: AAA family ATPase [Halobacteriovoraceae bacterium]|nr:AAA family ATPase [Halobacteriovoraceae bacterium]